MAFRNGIFGFAEHIPQIIKFAGAVKAVDRKAIMESRFQALAFTLALGTFALQEILVRLHLDLNEIGEVHGVMDLGEIFSFPKRNHSYSP